MGLFRGFSSSLFRLGLAFGLAFTLTRWVARQASPKTVTPPPASHSRLPDPIVHQDYELSCQEVYRLSIWSQVHYGGLTRVDFTSPATRDKVLRGFMEKLDPYRLLFTEAEVSEFLSVGSANWDRWVRSRDCGFFENWFKRAYSPARARFQARLHTMPVNSLFPQRLTEFPPEAPHRVKKLKRFAKNEAELRQRLEKAARRVAASTYQRLLEAYGMNRLFLLEDSFNQILFTNEALAKNILAKSILATLDPYSTYFSPPEFEDFYADLTGGTAGVGIRVRWVPRGFLVEKIVKDSPADRSRRMQVGDVITKVDGHLLAPLKVTAARGLLKGPENSSVSIVLEKGRSQKTVELKLIRKEFSFEETRIRGRVVKRASSNGDKKIGVIQIPSFYGKGGLDPTEGERSSSEDLHETLRGLLKKETKLSALVLDMRGNPGGYLEEAVSMAGFFIGDKPVVGVLENKQRRVLHDTRSSALYTGPLVVLVDEESASAAELLAGALKDHQRAVLVGGGRTFGKGSVQKIFQLEDEMVRVGFGSQLGSGAVKLTTSLFFTPMGHSPANGGIKTHIEIPGQSVGDSPELASTIGDRIPEEKHFLEPKAARQVKAQEGAFNNLVARLETMSDARTTEAQPGKELTVLKGVPLSDAELEKRADEYEFDETVSIAKDLSEQTSSSEPLATTRVAE